MGSPGRQILHCFGSWPSAHWPSCSSPFPWSESNVSTWPKNTFCSPGDGILFVLGAQLCRDLLPEPHFKHFSWMELSVMLVSPFCQQNIRVLRNMKVGFQNCLKGLGQPARVGRGPHRARLDLGLQVHVASFHLEDHITFKISRPDHWANAAMFSWKGVTYTIAPQLVREAFS